MHGTGICACVYITVGLAKMEQVSVSKLKLKFMVI